MQKAPRKTRFGVLFWVLLREFLLGEEALSFLGEGDAAFGHGLEVGRTGGECGL